MATATSRASIDAFLAGRRIAFVGVSREERDFSRGLLRELVARGYDVVPVNPACETVEGRPCYGSVRDVPPPLDGALLMTPPAATAGVVRDCAEAHVPRVWMHRGGGQGAVSDEAVRLADELGLDAVVGECPYMFLPDTGLPHRVHRFFKRLAGRLPA